VGAIEREGKPSLGVRQGHRGVSFCFVSEGWGDERISGSPSTKIVNQSSNSMWGDDLSPQEEIARFNREEEQGYYGCQDED